MKHLSLFKKRFFGIWSLCAAVFGGAANAQTASENTLQVYGLLAPMLDVLYVKDAAVVAPDFANRPSMLPASIYNGVAKGSATRMQGSTSHFGIRGSENLGNGLKAIFQIESRVPFDAASSEIAFASRNTRVGLAGDFGTAFIGNWDSPIAWSHLGLTSGARNPYAGDSSNLFVTSGFNMPHSVTVSSRVGSPADAVFNRRQGNSIQYWSPNWDGFSFRLAYSPDEGKKAAPNGATYKPSVGGLGLEYAKNAWLIRYVYQEHRDLFGLAWVGSNLAANPDVKTSKAQSSKDSNHRLIARYNLLPNWVLQGTFDRLDYSVKGVEAGFVNAYQRDSYALLLLTHQGAHSAWVNVGLSQDGKCALSGASDCKTQDLGATAWSLGYRYNFSKRSDVFTSVYQVRNRANAQYGIFPRPTAGIAPGSTQTGLTLGIEHSF